jgi:hypothetical protein
LDDVSLNLIIGSTTQGSPILVDFEELVCLGHGETSGIYKDDIDVIGNEVASGWSTRISWINNFGSKKYEFVLESARKCFKWWVTSNSDRFILENI